jgi:hypothetical protein
MGMDSSTQPGPETGFLSTGVGHVRCFLRDRWLISSDGLFIISTSRMRRCKGGMLIGESTGSSEYEVARTTPVL